MSAQRHLRIIEHDNNGEYQELARCPDCMELERELARMRTIIANLRRDKEAEARGHELWPQAYNLFSEWKTATGHTKSRWPGRNGERFWDCESYLRTDGFVICRWAVWGIAYMPNTKRLPTGDVERYDGWELCFRNRDNFERYARRGYLSPEARKQFSLRARGLGEDDETIDPNKHFERKAR